MESYFLRCNLRDFPDKVINNSDFLHLLTVHLLNLADQDFADKPVPVSYTHLDVYKRQVLGHQPAAGRVRKSRHRAKNCPVGQGDISDFQRIHLIPRFA